MLEGISRYRKRRKEMGQLCFLLVCIDFTEKGMRQRVTQGDVHGSNAPGQEELPMS